ncbi:MAG: DUF4188 domain-containing protein [Nitrococcus sp.]|nr:DUF4188 domain-containing protein [Nitrococcus sp.]
MKKRAQRHTVDLSGYPDLVVIYLGMKVNALTGIKTLFGFGPKIGRSVKSTPEGLLAHEYFLFSLLPPHLGIRQYWRDFESLEDWARSEPHRIWWAEFLRDTGGTGFWHETYCKAGGMEAVYVDIFKDIGFRHFAPVQPARHSMFTARDRVRRAGQPKSSVAIEEDELYS